MNRGLQITLTVTLTLMMFVAGSICPGCDRSPTSPATKPAAESDATRTQLTIAIGGAPATIDPVKVLDINSNAACVAAHAPLALIDGDGAMKMVIARKIAISRDATSCIIELNPQSKFWDDDASPVTADDVIYSFERLRATPHPHRWILSNIDGVDAFDKKTTSKIGGLRAIDERTVEVRFARPDPDFGRFICSSLTSIVKSGSDALPTRPLDSHVIGCGPFKPANQAAFDGVNFKFLRNPGYPFPSSVQELTLRVVQEPQNQLDGIASGKLDVVRLRGPMINEVIESSAGAALVLRPSFNHLRLETARGNELTFAIWNWKSTKLAAVAPADRRSLLGALSASIDRRGLAESLYKGYAVPTESVIPPVLSTSGFTMPAQPLPTSAPRGGLTLLSANDPASRQIASYLQGQFNRDGVKVDLEFVELNTLVARVLNGQFDVATLWIEQQIPSGVAAWTQFFAEGSPFAAIGQPIPDVSTQLDKARQTTDDTARAAAYKRLANLIDSENLAWQPILSRDSVQLLAPNVAGVFTDVNGVNYWTFIDSKPTRPTR